MYVKTKNIKKYWIFYSVCFILLIVRLYWKEFFQKKKYYKAFSTSYITAKKCEEFNKHTNFCIVYCKY